MSWRNTLNEKPMLVGGVIVGLLVVLVGFWVVRAFSGGGPTGPKQAYYTIDEGTTWFSDSIGEIPPFEHDGKQAVRAYLFKCADGKEFVGYLERYTDKAKATLEQFKADKDAGKKITNSQEVAAADMGGKLVKRPGDKEWIGGTGMALGRISTQITCPDKSKPQAVE